MKHDAEDKKITSIQHDLLENELGEQFGKLGLEERDAKIYHLTVITCNSCLLHRYIRDKNLHHIFERSGRIQSIYKTLDYLKNKLSKNPLSMKIVDSCRLPLLDDEYILEVHGKEFVEMIGKWCQESVQKLSTGGNELPDHLDLDDLYVCPDTITSLKGCIGSIYDAIDYVCKDIRRSNACFCAVRPPGHHATKDSPMGFCFINNVVVGSIYAHKKYHIQRIAILDIDLHHGNGTQELIRELNKRNNPKETEKNKQLRLFYGSLHDILSYPCETGKDSFIDAASLCLMDHGQYIWNVHLDPWKTLQDFEKSYTEKYSQLLRKTELFFKGCDPRYCLIMISAGFDAHEMEYRTLQRHNRKLPNCFYHKFTTDVMRLAEISCEKKIVSILEGGYSDCALMQGSCGHLGALMGLSQEESTLPTDLTSSPSISPSLTKRSSRKSIENSSEINLNTPLKIKNLPLITENKNN